MSAQNDVLDTSLLEEGGAKSASTKTVSIPEGTTKFRLIEQPGEGRKEYMKTHFYYWFKFSEQQEDGTIKSSWAPGTDTFVAKGHKNPMQIALQKVLAEKDALESQYATKEFDDNGNAKTRINTDAMTTEEQTRYDELKEKARLYKKQRHVFVNAVTKEGEVVILKMPQTAADAAKKAIIDAYNMLKKADPTGAHNPVSKHDASKGVWLEFSRTGKMLSTKYDVKPATIQDGLTQTLDMTPIDQTVVDNYENLGKDLDTLFIAYTDEELEKILEGDKSVIDSKIEKLYGKSTGSENSTEGSEEQGSSLESTEEESFQEDEIPNINV